ncbi:MAG TPA: rhodanese-like domain-containing protein [Steroidobacteraceae bacterium]|nr:rhodanese-like domain-containing protein [Steroidobacteraceae bacterium]
MDRLLDFAGHHPVLVAAVAMAGFLVLAFEYYLHRQGTSAVSPQELIRLMNQGALVLDVRGEEQFAAGHIGGARQLPQAQLERAAETLKKHREKPVVVYADGDTRGPAVVRALTAQGFTRAFCLRGGIDSWRAENLPLAKGST